MQSRNWCLTFFNEPLYIKGGLDSTCCNFFIGQLEIAPSTGKEHWQCYAEFEKKMSMKQLKDFFEDNTIHCEPRRGTQIQAIEYCRKVETRSEIENATFEHGKPKQQGKRSDIDAIYDDLVDGDDLETILHNHRGNALRMMHAVEKAAGILHGFNRINEFIKMKNQLKDKPHLKYKNSWYDQYIKVSPDFKAPKVES